MSQLVKQAVSFLKHFVAVVKKGGPVLQWLRQALDSIPVLGWLIQALIKWVTTDRSYSVRVKKGDFEFEGKSAPVYA